MTIEPIRLSDIRKGSDAAISRMEAERQFRFSFALVIILVIGTLAATATLPLGSWDDGYGTMSATMRVADNEGAR
jgi:hypothetical protein